MLERLHKILARAGVAALRPAEDMILEGRVSVNGRVVRELGARADADVDVIAVDGVPLDVPKPSDPHQYIMLHKPTGVISTAHDTHGRPTVVDIVPSGGRLFPVGRLDADSEGLILLTDDGDLAYRLTHPRFEVDKEYRVLVDITPQLPELRQWRSGIEIDDEMTAPAWVEVLDRTDEGTWLRIVMREGRKRQIREVARALGMHVRRLIRVREGPLALADLAPGAWRALTQAEVESLRAHTQHVPSREADEERERKMSEEGGRRRRLRVIHRPAREGTAFNQPSQEHSSIPMDESSETLAAGSNDDFNRDHRGDETDTRSSQVQSTERRERSRFDQGRQDQAFNRESGPSSDRGRNQQERGTRSSNDRAYDRSSQSTQSDRGRNEGRGDRQQRPYSERTERQDSRRDRPSYGNERERGNTQDRPPYGNARHRPTGGFRDRSGSSGRDYRDRSGPSRGGFYDRGGPPQGGFRDRNGPSSGGFRDRGRSGPPSGGFRDRGGSGPPSRGFRDRNSSGGGFRDRSGAPSGNFRDRGGPSYSGSRDRTGPGGGFRDRERPSYGNRRDADSGYRGGRDQDRSARPSYDRDRRAPSGNSRDIGPRGNDRGFGRAPRNQGEAGNQRGEFNPRGRRDAGLSHDRPPRDTSRGFDRRPAEPNARQRGAAGSSMDRQRGGRDDRGWGTRGPSQDRAQTGRRSPRDIPSRPPTRRTDDDEE